MNSGSDHPGLDLAVLDDPAALTELAPAWQALWQQARGRFSDSPAACTLAWTHVAEPAGARLALLTGRRDGRLVLVMPMVVRRRGPLRVLRPLGPAAADCTGMLLDPACDETRVLAGAWQRLARTCAADVAQLPGVVAGTTLHAELAGQPAARVTGSDVLPVARPAEGQTFEQYCTGLGKLSHYRPGGLRRRLARTGELTVSVLDPGDASAPGLVDWLLQRKREWADRAGKVGPWLDDPGYRDYLAAAVMPRQGGAPARLLALRLDGAPVAVALLGLGVSLVEGMSNAYDPAYGKYSPGLVLVEACVEWAFGQGSGIDMGVGSEDYKQYWSRGEGDQLLNLQIPLGVRGRLALDLRDAARRARHSWRRPV